MKQPTRRTLAMLEGGGACERSDAALHARCLIAQSRGAQETQYQECRRVFTCRLGAANGVHGYLIHLKSSTAETKELEWGVAGLYMKSFGTRTRTNTIPYGTEANAAG